MSKQPKKRQDLYQNESWLSDITYGFMNKVVDKGLHQTMEHSDLYELPSDMHYENYYPKFEAFYKQKMTENPQTGLGQILLSFFKVYILKTVMFATFGVVFDISIPIWIKLYIAWVGDPTAEWWLGVIWGCAIVIAFFAKLQFNRRAFHVIAVNQYLAGLVLRGIMYNKLTKLSREAVSNLDLGNLSNIMNHDTFKIQLLIRLGIFAYVTPCLTIAGLVFFFVYMNWLAVIFPARMILWLSIIIGLNLIMYYYQNKILVVADKRSKLTAECLSGIKNIKFEGWEDISLKRLQDYRTQESNNLFKYFYIRNLMNGFSELFAPIFLLIFISIYTFAYEKIPIDKAFLLISLSNQMQSPLKASVTLLDSWASSKLAIQRIMKLLAIPEDKPHVFDTSLTKGQIIVENASTGWFSKNIVDYFKSKEDPDKICLKHVSFNFETAKMYAVVGKVGSGKTAFLTSLLGEMSIKTGSIKRNGTLAYIPQVPFLLNASIRENILFGEEWNLDRYAMCLVKCRLVDDIKVLPAGDTTEVGERGVNLSGGQKQRISLARALYANRDIYLVDDTLSALDSQVARSVFENVIVGEFKNKGKTVVLVTHALSVVGDCDQVLVLDKGEIALAGPFAQIKDHAVYIEYSRNAKKNEEETGPQKQETQAHTEVVAYDLEKEIADLKEHLNKAESKTQDESLGKIIKKEEKQAGRVSLSVYWKYILSFNPLYFFFGFLGFMCYIAVRQLSDLFIGYWATETWNWTQSEYQRTYLVMVSILVFLVIVRSCLVSLGMSNVGISLNGKMFSTIFKRPISYFESTPIGVIINRCTKEMLDLDLIFNNFLQHMMANSSLMLAMALILCITMPFMIPIIFLVFYFWFRMVKIVTLVNSAVKRITQVATAPVISNVAELFNGQTTISAYQLVGRLKAKFNMNMSNLLISEQHERYLENWVFWRIEMSVVVLIFFTVGFIYLIKQANIEVFNKVTSLSLGLSVAAVSGDFVGFLLFCLGEVLKGMNSVERMLELAEANDLEPDHHTPKPPASWPTSSKIEISNLRMRYRPNLPLVLNNVCLNVASAEKVGIVGRTGSGKSSLILALMRIIEIERLAPGSKPVVQEDPFELPIAMEDAQLEEEQISLKRNQEDGHIKIDGVDVQSIGVRFARSAITLIPQDAFVMSGTIRSNIDPHNSHKDEEIKDVLVKTKLYQSLKENLDRKTNTDAQNNKGESASETDVSKQIINMPTDSNGSNLSQGQKQLLCIARALIKKPKVLLMDEATASIDTKTDEIIQGLIKTEFKDSTIITIAHRLNTIIQYDKILSLRGGRVIDYGKPSELLRDPKSYFCELVKQNCEEFYQEMLALADTASK